MAEAERYRPIAEYAFISDCHCAALISREGSVDWCCMPRFDSGSAFGRLLDADRGGFCAPAAASCPSCGGLRVRILPGPPGKQDQ